MVSRTRLNDPIPHMAVCNSCQQTGHPRITTSWLLPRGCAHINFVKCQLTHLLANIFQPLGLLDTNRWRPLYLNSLIMSRWLLCISFTITHELYLHNVILTQNVRQLQSSEEEESTMSGSDFTNHFLYSGFTQTCFKLCCLNRLIKVFASSSGHDNHNLSPELCTKPELFFSAFPSFTIFTTSTKSNWLYRKHSGKQNICFLVLI